MSATIAISAASHRRIQRAGTWLQEKVLIIAATLDAANELVRNVAREKGAVFGWHRFSLAGLAATLATRLRVQRKLTPLSRIGSEAIMTRVVHRAHEETNLGRYELVGDTPGFSQAVASVIAELRLAKRTSDAIGEVAPDLVPLVNGYQSALADAGLRLRAYNGYEVICTRQRSYMAVSSICEQCCRLCNGPSRSPRRGAPGGGVSGRGSIHREI